MTKAESRAPKNRLWTLGRILAFGAALVAVLLLGSRAGHLLPALVARVDALGAWGPVAFVFMYAIAVVALIQLVALGYGLWTVFIARPVHLVFEIDRFRVVHAIEHSVRFVGHQPLGDEGVHRCTRTLPAGQGDSSRRWNNCSV